MSLTAISSLESAKENFSCENAISSLERKNVFGLPEMSLTQSAR